MTTDGDRAGGRAGGADAEDALGTVVGRRPAIGWSVVSSALAVVVLLSLVLGSMAVPLGTSSTRHLVRRQRRRPIIVRDQRIPRTVLAVLVGAALGGQPAR